MSDPHTFHPNVNDISKFLVENNEAFHGDFKNFQSRQEEFIQRQLEKREQLRSQYSQEAQYSFKPKINITSEVICAADPNRGNEKETQRIQRLYREDKLKSQAAK